MSLCAEFFINPLQAASDFQVPKEGEGVTKKLKMILELLHSYRVEQMIEESKLKRGKQDKVATVGDLVAHMHNADNTALGMRFGRVI